MARARHRVIRLTVDDENPLHQKLSQWLTQFERRSGRRSRRTSYHLLAAMMLYMDVQEGRSRVVPVGDAPSHDEVISRALFQVGSAADLEVFTRPAEGVSSPVPPSKPIVPVEPSPVPETPPHSSAVVTHPAPTGAGNGGDPLAVKRSVIGDAGFGGASIDDY